MDVLRRVAWVRPNSPYGEPEIILPQEQPLPRKGRDGRPPLFALGARERETQAELGLSEAQETFDSPRDDPS
jgi:hypothetical protein